MGAMTTLGHLGRHRTSGPALRHFHHLRPRPVIRALIAVVLGWTGTRATTARPTTSSAEQPGAGASTSEAADILVAQLMKQDIYFLAPSDTIRQALHMFVDKRISGMPLLEDDRTPAGFVPDGDVLNVNDDLRGRGRLRQSAQLKVSRAK